MAGFKPLYDHVLVERVSEDEKTKGGIIIPDSAKEKPQEGKIIAVGDGRIMDNGQIQPLAVKTGDTVLFKKYSGTDVKLEGVEYIIINENDILGVVS